MFKIGTGHLIDLVFKIAGTLPGVLFLVVRECVHLVNLRMCMVVGLGAAMIGGGSMTRQIAMGGVAQSTLCSAHCSMGGSADTLRRSPGGNIHSSVGHMSVRLLAEGLVSVSFVLMSVRKAECLFAGIYRSAVTSASETSCKCSFHMRNGT